MSSGTLPVTVSTPRMAFGTPPSPTAKRLVSIDALRGFDMLLIAGADVFFHQISGKTGLAWVDAVAGQFHHPAWLGFTFYDFIFPLFLFIAGVSIPFSLSKALAQGMSKNDLYKKAFVRMLFLIGLGILDKNAPFPFFDWPHIRLGSVLGRIGIAGFVTVVLYLNFSSLKRLYIVGGVLLAYYAALMLIPVPGFGAGNLTFEGNLVGWFDRTFLPGRLLQRTYDENGILTQFPALCLTMLGAYAGEILHDSVRADAKKFVRLLLTGIVCVGLGLLWSLHFPIAKRLWSSSFILLTGGMAFVFMAVFYGVIDILNFKKWSFFFVVIGMNSLTIYLLNRFVNFRYTSRLLFEGLYAPLGEKWYGVFESLGGIALVWCLLYFLYRKKIFLRV
jgi:predicted acyltransferase